MTTCRLCGEHKKFIKAHAIPEAFFRVMRGERQSETPLLVTAGEFPRRAPIGVYDVGILCGDCEPRFGDLDGLGARVLLQDFDALFTPLRQRDEVVGYESTAVDATGLLRFLVATLWRASVSGHPFYHRIDLGRYEEAAKRFALDGEDAGRVFDAVLSRWPKPAQLGLESHGVMDPFRHKYDGVNAYRLYLGETVADIKVDQRAFPGGFAKIGLRNAPPVRVVLRDFSRSKEFAAMAKTAQLARTRRGVAPDLSGVS